MFKEPSLLLLIHSTVYSVGLLLGELPSVEEPFHAIPYILVYQFLLGFNKKKYVKLSGFYDFSASASAGLPTVGIILSFISRLYLSISTGETIFGNICLASAELLLCAFVSGLE